MYLSENSHSISVQAKEICIMSNKGILQILLTLVYSIDSKIIILGVIHKSYINSGNVSGYRCVSDCRSRGREFDPGPVPYFRGD